MDDGQLKIREAGQEDVEVVYDMICNLENEVLDRKSFEQVFQMNLTSSHVTYFVAEYEDVAVGIVSCHIQPLLHHAALVAEIQEMYVYPQFRSQRIGNRLMDCVVDFAKKQGAKQLEVTSRATRESAHKFYEREGFEKSHVKLVRYFESQ